jgi:hypothetical protein
MTRRSISVKIPTAKLISALEAKLKEYEDMRDNYDSLKAKHDKEMTKWRAEVSKLVSPKNMKEVGVSTTSWRNPGYHEVTISYLVPDGNVPEQPEAPKAFSYVEREGIDNIKNALNILRMTEQEEVSTSTYNAVAQYL